ncbi:hypothetical protein BV25DRAFT_1778221, partial [Artomyces pyxidatus]
FAQLWNRGEPVVVTDTRRVFQGNWTPDYFIKTFGSDAVHLVDCETEKEKRVTVADFFRGFDSHREDQTIYKLKDWPPTKNFEDKFRTLYKAFEAGSPFRDFTCSNGIFNLTAHFPNCEVSPDLGPKLYCAFGTLQDDKHNGSTRLHLDVTDAFNLMLYAADTPTGDPGGALWHIFAGEDSEKLRSFITGQSSPCLGDPIHNQSTYLTPEMLDVLAEQHNVRPYTIHQRPWQAVFIPAGCAHQVSNQTDSIKIACDFLSVENLAASCHLANELRRQRLVRGFGEDVLQVPTCLWYAWSSL